MIKKNKKKTFYYILHDIFMYHFMIFHLISQFTLSGLWTQQTNYKIHILKKGLVCFLSSLHVSMAKIKSKTCFFFSTVQ